MLSRARTGGGRTVEGLERKGRELLTLTRTRTRHFGGRGRFCGIWWRGFWRLCRRGWRGVGRSRLCEEREGGREEGKVESRRKKRKKLEKR